MHKAREQSSFGDRIARIQSGDTWAPEGVVVSKSKNRSKRASGNNPVSLLWGICFAALLVVGARAARFHLFPDQLAGGRADLQESLILDAGLAGGVLLVVFILGWGRSLLGTAGRAAGLTLGVLAMHIAVHSYPDLWAVAFSEAWVRDVLASTEPAGLLAVPAFGV